MVNNYNLTADGITDEFRAGPRTYPGSIITLYASGTFGGGTLTLECSPDGTNWFTAMDNSGSNITMVAAGMRQVIVNAEVMRFRLSGATSPTVTVWQR